MVLNGFIDKHKVTVWNFAEPASAVCDIVLDAGRPAVAGEVVHSDCDQELLLYIPFVEFMRLRGIAIIGGGAGTGPYTVSLFTNQPEMHGFDTVQRQHPDEQLELVDSSDDDEMIYLLDPGKFSSVGNLVIYVTRGHGDEDDVTTLRKILLFGESTRLPTQRPVVKNVVYELRGNPADHPETEDEQRKKFSNLVK